MRVYLLISGRCEDDSHEGIVAVCVSVGAAKARAQRRAVEHAAWMDSLPYRKGLPPSVRPELRWREERDGSWEEMGYGPVYRIEPWDVEEG